MSSTYISYQLVTKADLTSAVEVTVTLYGCSDRSSMSGDNDNDPVYHLHLQHEIQSDLAKKTTSTSEILPRPGLVRWSTKITQDIYQISHSWIYVDEPFSTSAMSDHAIWPTFHSSEGRHGTCNLVHWVQRVFYWHLGPRTFEHPVLVSSSNFLSFVWINSVYDSVMS